MSRKIIKRFWDRGDTWHGKEKSDTCQSSDFKRVGVGLGSFCVLLSGLKQPALYFCVLIFNKVCLFPEKGEKLKSYVRFGAFPKARVDFCLFVIVKTG